MFKCVFVCLFAWLVVCLLLCLDVCVFACLFALVPFFVCEFGLLCLLLFDVCVVFLVVCFWVLLLLLVRF